MLNIKYQNLCSIAFRHEYYRDGVSRDFTLIPTETTQNLMQTYGLYAKNTGGKTIILQKMDKNVVDTPFTQPICLTFAVQLNNPALLSVSRLSDKRQFYLSNIQADGTYRALLTEQAVLSDKDALPPMRPQQYSLNIPKDKFKKIEISRVLAGGIKNYPPLSIERDMETVLLKFPASGKYTLTKQPSNPGDISEIVYANSEINTSLFGIVELFLDRTLVPPMNYAVAIEARRFKWQYFLTDTQSKDVNYNNDPANVRLTYTRNPNDLLSPNIVLFAYKGIQTISPDAFKVMQNIGKISPEIKQIMLFESDNNIPILESRSPTIEMTVLPNTSYKPKLPVPDITSLNVRLSPTRNPADPDDPLAHAMMFYSI